MTALFQRFKALLNLPPRAWRFFRTHGLLPTLVRIFDALVRDQQHGSVVAANRWLDNDCKTTAPTSLGTTALSHRSIAIIGALDLAQCKKYRVIQKIEQLAGQHDCEAVISGYQDVPRSFDALQLATAVIFYRVPDGELFRAYLKEARRLGLPIAYDIDDPIFSRSIYRENANLKALTLTERRHLLASSRDYLRAMRACDACIVSTPGMVEAASTVLDGPVYLWRNALDAESIAIAREIIAAGAAAAEDECIRIGYMSGSRAHDADFELIASALAETMARHPRVELVLAGHASIPAALEPYSDRITRRPFASYHAYYAHLAQLDILVIPLLTGTFNACKSAIRYLEAALLGKPCVISAVGDFLNIVHHGETGYLADSSSEWCTHLNALIESAELRQRIGQQAGKDVQHNQSAAHVAATLESGLVEFLRGPVHV